MSVDRYESINIEGDFLEFSTVSFNTLRDGKNALQYYWLANGCMGRRIPKCRLLRILCFLPNRELWTSI